MGFFKTASTDLLNEAHTLGLSALQSFEDLALDLETASDLAATHADNAAAASRQLSDEANAAEDASVRYGNSASKIRALVS